MRSPSMHARTFRFLPRIEWAFGLTALSLSFVACDNSVQDVAAVPETQTKEISLSGRVLSVEGMPIKDAGLSLGNLGTVTDSNGSWKIEGSVAQVAAGATLGSLPRLVYRLDDQVLAKDSLLSPVQSGLVRWVRTLPVSGQLSTDSGVHVDSLAAWVLGSNAATPVRIRVAYDSVSKRYSGKVHLLGSTDGARYDYRIWMDVFGNGGRLTGRSDTLAASNASTSLTGSFDSMKIGNAVPHGFLRYPEVAVPGTSVLFTARNESRQKAVIEWSVGSAAFTAGDSTYVLELDSAASGTRTVACRFRFEDGSVEVRTGTVRILNGGLQGGLAADGTMSFHAAGDSLPGNLVPVPVKGVTDGEGTRINLSVRDSGQARIDALWGAVPGFGAWAGMDVALASDGKAVDLSGKFSLRLRYRTSTTRTQVDVYALSPLYASNTTGSLVMMGVVLPSSTEWRDTTLVLYSFQYQQWMLDRHGEDCALSWQDLKTSISGFRISPKASYNGDGVTIQDPEAWLEVTDLKLLDP